MKLTIDAKACFKHKMTLSEVFLALAVRSANNLKEVLDNAVKREIFILKDKNIMITQHWNDILDEVLADSGSIQDENRLKELAKTLRELYPEGRIIDRRTGKPTSFYFRCNPKEIEQKLKTFFFRYGNYSDKDIIDATKRYVASFNGNYQQKGFRQLKYFIWKDDPKQGPDGNYVESISPLLDFLENKESEEGVVVTNSDEWMTKLV